MRSELIGYFRNPSAFWKTSAEGLVISPKHAKINEKESPSVIFTRQQHTNFTAETTVRFAPTSEKTQAGLVLMQKEDHNFVFVKTLRAGKPVLVLERAERGNAVIASTELTGVHAAGNEPLRLKVVGNGRYYDFYYAEGNADYQLLAKGVDAVNLSTHQSGGFIGAVIGLYAVK